MSEKQKDLIVRFYHAHDLAHLIANHEKLIHEVRVNPVIKETLLEDVRKIKRILEKAKLEGEK